VDTELEAKTTRKGITTRAAMKEGLEKPAGDTKMNPQPDPIVGQVLGMVLIVVIFVLCAVAWNNPEKYAPKKKSDWDLFKLGEIYEEEDQYYPPPTVTHTASPKPKPKPKKKRKPAKSAKPAKPMPHPLFEDGVSALAGLGHKKTESKKAVADVLAKFNPSTIEDLIKLVYQKK
jgi:hypothetical protein